MVGAGAAADRVRMPARARFLPARLDARPAEDRRRLVAAEIMRAVYFETLQRIEQQRLRRVFHADARPQAGTGAIALRQWLLPT